MTNARKRTLFAAAGAVGLLILLAFVAARFVSAERFKPRLESVASDLLGMDVRVRGRMGIGLFPGFHITAEDAHVLSPRGESFAAVRRTNLYFDLLPLLVRDFRLRRVELRRPAVAFTRGAGGAAGAPGLESVGRLLGALDGVSVSVSDGSLVYSDSASGRGFEATGLRLAVRGRPPRSGAHPKTWKDASLEAKIVCAAIRTKRAEVSLLRASVEGNEGVFDFEPVTMRVFGATANGSLRADFSGAVPRYRVRFALPAFRIEKFLAAASADTVGTGAMDFSASLSARGRTRRELVESVAGECSLRGDRLKLTGTDLDGAISRFESSQHFNIVDVGAVFLVGPLGLAVTKGYNFASLFRGGGGETGIGRFVSDWKVERGVAQATDVAMTTKENRIALQGGLDFVNGRFTDVTVAVVDEKGCAKLRQTIRGEFASPEIEKPHALTTLVGPVVKLVKTARDILPSGPCERFYAGSVAPPEK